MRIDILSVCALGMALLVPWAAAEDAADTDAYYEEQSWVDNPYLNWEPIPETAVLAARAGVWGVATSGSKTMVGEWQGLDGFSPFYDIDGLFTNGYRTIDFSITGTENESTLGRLDFYNGPGLRGDVDYRRFIHRLGHDPLSGIEKGPPIAGTPPFVNMPREGGFYEPPLNQPQPGHAMFAEDLNRGQDYALRVQQLNANFKGNLASNVRWRLNVWGMQKQGDRQANATQHCFQAGQTTANPDNNNIAFPRSNTCHVVSQSQSVDWLTMQVEPGIEVQLGAWTFEYSRTMRSFQQDDQLVTRNWARNTPYGFGNIAGLESAENGAYAYVPENYTEIDRIKLHGDLGWYTNLYALGYVGNTHNEFRDSDRKFYGADVRVTNTALSKMTNTVYGKASVQNNSEDTTSLNVRYPDQKALWLERTTMNLPNPNPPPVTFPLGTDVPPQDMYTDATRDDYDSLVDRFYSAAGITSRWRPFANDYGLINKWAVVSGYEYSRLNRDNADYGLERQGVVFTQPDSTTNMFFTGVEQVWTEQFNSYVRYRWIDTDYPLVGVREWTERFNGLDPAINSNQPEHIDRIELGGTYTPYNNLMFSASIWLQNSYNTTDYVRFDEDSYPIVLTAWYAPTDRSTWTVGYANLTNWINQDITLGIEDGFNNDGTVNAAERPAFTAPWSYAGRADVFNIGTTYAVTVNLRLVGGFEYVRGENYFDPPPITVAPIPYTDLPAYSAIETNIYRFNAGFDYELRRYVNTYFRYNYYDYDDAYAVYNNGTAHAFLAGLSGTF